MEEKIYLNLEKMFGIEMNLKCIKCHKYCVSHLKPYDLFSIFYFYGHVAAIVAYSWSFCFVLFPC